MRMIIKITTLPEQKWEPWLVHPECASKIHPVPVAEALQGEVVDMKEPGKTFDTLEAISTLDAHPQARCYLCNQLLAEAHKPFVPREEREKEEMLDLLRDVYFVIDPPVPCTLAELSENCDKLIPRVREILVRERRLT